MQCDYTDFTLPEEGRLLLCTDGLTNMVETDDIYAIVRSMDTEQSVGALLDAANAAGGSDNITAVMIA